MNVPILPFADTKRDFSLVRTQTGRGLYASGSDNYRDAIFGRDSLEAAEDILGLHPEVAREVILTMAWLQGVSDNPVTEEEPGRIHHEYRHMIMDGRPINLHSESILRQLAELWGGTDQEVLYYGSVDATPLYVRLVANYCATAGKSILDQAVRRHDGQETTVRRSVEAAMSWIERRLSASPLGLLEFCRSNDRGHAYQVWKDGGSSYLHLDGRRANFRQPIASIEVQGLAYDALMLSGDLLSDASGQQRWQRMAQQIRQTVLDKFWLPEVGYFAQALDRDPDNGQVRPVATLTSNPAEALDTGLFAGLDEESASRHIGGIVRTIMASDFLTDVGIRCRAKQHAELVSFADYHGAWAVWPKATFDIARGMSRFGFDRLAQQLHWRILNGVRISGRNYEFWMVDPDGRVDYNPDGLRPRSGRQLHLPTIHVAEAIQAWTITAVMAIESFWQQPPPKRRVPGWVRDLEDKVLSDMPKVDLITSPEQAAAAYPQDYTFLIDLAEGRERRLEFFRHLSALEQMVD